MRPFFSRYASCASASYGATTYGMFSAFRTCKDHEISDWRRVTADQSRLSHLDELVCHLWCHIYSFDIVFPCLRMLAFQRQSSGRSKRFIASSA